MKTVSVPHAKFACLMLICSIFSVSVFSQSNTLSFQNAVLVSGSNNKLHAVYKFPAVANGVDALVSIDSMVNGASVTQIDETGVGYEKAFQPRVKAGNVSGESYVVFSIKLVEAGTNFPKVMSSISATAVDI